MPPPADRDADDLVVRAALGEPLSDDEQRWLDVDPDLRTRVAEFVEVIDLARTAPDEVASDDQIEHLWQGIAAETVGDHVGRDAGGPTDAGAGPGPSAP